MQSTDNKPEEINGPGNDSQHNQNTNNKPADGSLRKKLRIPVIITVCVAAIAGGIFYFRGLSYESSNDAFIDGNITPISARVSSHVDKVYVAANQFVKSGDLLVELNPDDYRAQLNLARASLEAAKAVNQSDIINIDLTTISSTSDLDSARAEYDYASASLAEAESDLKALEARYQEDKSNLARYREISDSITVQQLDHAVSSEKMSAADFESAQRKVTARQAMVREAEVALEKAKSAPQRIEQTRARANVSSADIRRAMATVELGKLKLSYTKIYAPCDGYVTKKI